MLLAIAKANFPREQFDSVTIISDNDQDIKAGWNVVWTCGGWTFAGLNIGIAIQSVEIEENEMHETRHIYGTLPNGNAQHFVVTKTGKLSLNGYALTLDKNQLANIRNVSVNKAFDMARKYWHS